MHNVYEFIGEALRHVDPATKPKSAIYPIPSELVGSDQWYYLHGSFGQAVTDWLIEYRWKRHYCNVMTRAKYDSYVSKWKKNEDHVTDCQGLLDAYLTYVVGEYTDINADTNYREWCEQKGLISKITRDYVIGEAVFMDNSGTKNHIGWICGFTDGGEPLVIEARSIAYGVVITNLSSRNWTHRGLMTKRFDYTAPIVEPIKLELTSPVMQGEGILNMQKSLNALGYTDANGRKLSEDGKCGERTLEAVTEFANAHTAIEPKVITVIPEFVEKLVLEQYGLTVGVMHTEDIQEAANE